MLSRLYITGCVSQRYEWLQGIAASDINSLATLLQNYQHGQAAAGEPALGNPGPVGSLEAMADPLACLDASIKGNLSPGNVSLLKPWGQPMPEVSKPAGQLLLKRPAARACLSCTITSIWTAECLLPDLL